MDDEPASQTGTLEATTIGLKPARFTLDRNQTRIRAR